MRGALQRTPTASLLFYVVGVDAFVWLCAFPFELYCRTMVAGHTTSDGFLGAILLANALILILMLSAMAGGGELVRRGSFRGRAALIRLLFRSDPDGLDINELVNSERG